MKKLKHANFARLQIEWKYRQRKKFKHLSGNELNRDTPYFNNTFNLTCIIWRQNHIKLTLNVPYCILWKWRIYPSSSCGDMPCITCSGWVKILSYGCCYAITGIHRAHNVRCHQDLLHLCFYYGSLNHEEYKIHPMERYNDLMAISFACQNYKRNKF